MSVQIKKGLIGGIFTLVALPWWAVVGADQSDFDSREQQTLRPHDFDVQHYRIELDIEESTHSFDGETVITFSSTVDGLSEITLDSVNFDVSHVADESGETLNFIQREGYLDISLDRELASNELASLTIGYGVANLDGNVLVGLDFRDETETNPGLVNSLNWPNGARYWFPSFDHPSDWATHETIITVDAGFEVLANGALLSDRVDTESGRRTVHWQQSKPQPTYLYMFAAGPYSVLEDQHDDLPLHYWVYPGDETVAAQAFRNTAEIIAYFEELYSTSFPWVKYDQVIVPGMGGGAESTSATLLTRNVIDRQREGNDNASDWLIAHEIAHQWWGNMIGFRDWGHNWLSESFATHGEYLYIAHAMGPDEGALYIDDYKKSYLTEAKTKFRRPVVTDRWDKGSDMFDRHAYEKGGIILNMLRELTGHEAFAEIMRSFLEKHAYSNAVSNDFFETVNTVTNQDYGWFFDQWLLKPGHPELDVSYTWDKQKKSLSLTINQTQDTSTGTPIYRLPIRLGITTMEGKQVESLWLNEPEQTFTFDVAHEPLLVRFDEDDILLKEWAFDKSTVELLYQLTHDGVIGRLWAVGELEKHIETNGVRAALTEVAHNDPVKAVRDRAAEVALPDRPAD